MIDDSGLFHGAYDPVKAREYYLRTRKLKGRKSGSGLDSEVVTSRNNAPQAGKVNRSNTESRRAELKAQKEALNKRLKRLQEVLAELVDAAKARSGVEKSDREKDAAPETKVDKADRNKAEKKDKPESPSEKKERAKKAKEAYEKEHPNSLSKDVEILQAQVEDIQAKIRKAVSDAQDRRNKAGSRVLKSGSKVKNNNPDGPRGR